MSSLAAAGVVVLGAVGYFCLFRPESVQKWFQKQHDKSGKLVQNWPLSKFIFQPWYPTYLWLIGVVACAMATFLAYAVYSTLTR
jgi:hypothetical protein